jgi:hypothetical protein
MVPAGMTSNTTRESEGSVRVNDNELKVQFLEGVLTVSEAETISLSFLADYAFPLIKSR